MKFWKKHKKSKIIINIGDILIIDDYDIVEVIWKNDELIQVSYTNQKRKLLKISEHNIKKYENR